ncbi:helix-turn-helix domain-containing protein [Pectobacterium sp. B1J-3]|uniref:helix-turn-helix domain-containing protein n=1 Tax=Pectobacterium sp. B1J-3 TaxID=3385371 RepID=UPI00390672BA
MSNRLSIGKKIADARKNMGNTQQQMADVTGIFKTTLSKIENGRFTGSLDILERYLDAVGLQLNAEPKQHTLPKWDEIDDLFSEDE